MPLLTNLKTGLSLAYVREHQVRQRSWEWLVPVRLFGEALVHQCVSLFFILLVVSGILSYTLGAKTDAFIFWGITAINLILGCAQEYKASKAGKALERHIRHTVTTRRGGVLQEIDGSELLVGDIILLAPGDIIVADVQVRLSKDAFVDESMRTGETFPITVKNDALLYAGSSVVSGTITAQVTQAYQQSSLMQYAHRVDTVKKNNDFSIFLGRVSFLDVCRRYFLRGGYRRGFVFLVSCLFFHGIIALRGFYVGRRCSGITVLDCDAYSYACGSTAHERKGHCKASSFATGARIYPILSYR
jgi:magnesium-transporting ATPase (P-type)